MEDRLGNVFAPAEDAAAADWVLANLRDFAGDVGSVVPACFERYARVFHPASRWVRDASEADERAARLWEADGTVKWLKTVRWAEVAAANGRQMHPATQWGSIIGAGDFSGQPGVWDSAPEFGAPPLSVAAELVAVLAEFTGTPDRCWFGVSEIWGSPLHEHLQATPTFGTPYRTWQLVQGPLMPSAIVFPHRECALLADLWWPEDRAWFVGSDVDLRTTYVGASDACIRALLQTEALEALPTSVDDGITWDSDTINPLPPFENRHD
jgi:hypothetical protein